MSDININPIQRIVNKHRPTLQLMHNHAIAQSQRIVGQVYNRQSRNIAQFIREQRIFNKKMAQKHLFFNSNSNLPKNKRFGVTLRYEENERLELSFDKNLSVDQQDNSSEPNKAKNIISERDSREQTFKRSKKSFIKSVNLSNFKLQEKTKLNPRNLSIPLQNRKKTLTVSSPRSNLSPNLLDLPKDPRSRARKRVLTQVQPIDDNLTFANSGQKTSQDQLYGNNNPFIVLTKQKMSKFIKNLHKLAWMAQFLKGKPQSAQQSEEFKQHLRKFHYDSDLPISQNKLNYMVARRYGLLSFYLEDHYIEKMKMLVQHETSQKKQKFASHKDYPILYMASKKSILSLLTKNIQDTTIKFSSRQPQVLHQEKTSFSLPFAEFISERQTKASIYRLVRMTPNSYLKIAFGLYDKNKNGIIDEDDLLNVISLSRKMPQIQADLLVLCSTFNSPRIQVIRNRQRTINDREKSQRGKFSLIQTIKPIQQLDFQSRAQSEQQHIKINNKNAFSLDKFYIFLKNKKDQRQQRINVPKQPHINFSFTAFCKAFNGHRPAILTDLFQFLFGAQKEDFADSTNIINVNSSGRFENKLNQRQQTLQQKWNNRIKNTNNIVKKVIRDAKNL